MISFKNILTEAKGDRIKKKIKKDVEKLMDITPKIFDEESKLKKIISNKFNIKLDSLSDFQELYLTDKSKYNEIKNFIDTNYSKFVKMEQERHETIENIHTNLYKLPSDNIAYQKFMNGDYYLDYEPDLIELLHDLDA